MAAWVGRQYPRHPGQDCHPFFLAIENLLNKDDAVVFCCVQLHLEFALSIDA
jgi:hypothetical protein